MQRTRIDYLTHTWNPASGCRNWETGVCGGGGIDFKCWAKTQTERFPKLYPKGFEPTIYPESLMEPISLRKPSRIGVCFMGDLFGEWFSPDQRVSVSLYGKLDEKSIELVKVGLNPIPQFGLREAIFTTVATCPQHKFLFLTKCPWNLAHWNPWPDNAWVGASATNNKQFQAALVGLAATKARVKFISFEPLLERIVIQPPYDLQGMDWVILGVATNPYNIPRLEWVNAIVHTAKEAGIPVFLKNNLKIAYPLLNLWQELPKEDNDRERRLPD